MQHTLAAVISGLSLPLEVREASVGQGGAKANYMGTPKDMQPCEWLDAMVRYKMVALL